MRLESFVCTKEITEGNRRMELSGKTYVVFGVANKNSICWAIAQELKARGALVQLVCHPVMYDRVLKLTEGAGFVSPLQCDVSIQVSTEDCFRMLKEKVMPIDGIVHGIAFSDTKELTGRFIDTSRENFLNTMLISCYSFMELARRSQELMPNGGSILTLTFDASRGSYPHYNVMGLAKAGLEAAVNYTSTDLGEFGIRVNAIAASPEDTLSARGIGNFRLIGAFAEAMSPLGRRATVAEIAHVATFLLGSYASGITGQTIFVDCGSSAPKMPPARNAGKMADAMRRIDETYQKKA